MAEKLVIAPHRAEVLKFKTLILLRYLDKKAIELPPVEPWFNLDFTSGHSEIRDAQRDQLENV